MSTFWQYEGAMNILHRKWSAAISSSCRWVSDICSQACNILIQVCTTKVTKLAFNYKYCYGEPATCPSEFGVLDQ